MFFYKPIVKAILIILLFPFVCEAQFITRDASGFGLMDNAGKELLPMEYDTIYGLVPYEYKANEYFVLRKSGKHYLYAKLEKKILPFTVSKPEKIANSCAYRFENLDNPGNFGFIGLTMDLYGGKVEKTRYIAPNYQDVFSAWTQRACEVGVKGEYGYGLMDAATGDTICPLIFKHSVYYWSTTNSPYLIKSKDPKGIDSTCYYFPASGQVIKTRPNAEVEFLRADSSFMVYEPFVTNEYGLLELYDFNTGERLYHSRINNTIHGLKFERLENDFLSSDLYMIRTEHVKTATGQPHFTISVYDFSSKSRVYHLESTQFYTLTLDYYKNQRAYFLVRRNGPSPRKPVGVFSEGEWIWSGDR